VSDDVQRYTEALKRFTGDLRMTKQVFQSMKDRGVPIQPIHHQLLLKAHLDARDVDGAARVIDDMTAAGAPPDPAVRWDVAIATARAGRTDRALALLDQLDDEGVEPDPAHTPAVLGIYLAAGRFPAARAVLRRMAASGQAASDDEYATLLRDCLERRAIKDTRAIVDLMISVGRLPSPRLATDLVTMVARAGHTDRAIELLARLRDAGLDLPGEVHTELLLAHARAGDAAAAEGALEAMREAGAEPSSFHVNAVLQARIAGADVDGAWTTAVALADRGRIPSGENLEGLGRVSLGAGRLAAASGVVDWMLILGVPVPPQLLADVLAGHTKRGELDVAIDLFETAVAHGVPADRRAARDLVEGLVKASRLDEAKTLLDRLRLAGTLTHGRHYGPLLAALWVLHAQHQRGQAHRLQSTNTRKPLASSADSLLSPFLPADANAKPTRSGVEEAQIIGQGSVWLAESNAKVAD
jgi:pentatricopeptide repeat protein